jgi:hypothetical protein
MLHSVLNSYTIEKKEADIMTNDVVKLAIAWLGVSATASLALIGWGLFTVHSMAVDISSIKTIVGTLSVSTTVVERSMHELENRVTILEQKSTK